MCEHAPRKRQEQDELEREENYRRRREKEKRGRQRERDTIYFILELNLLREQSDIIQTDMICNLI